jgi:hypothetical protein
MGKALVSCRFSCRFSLQPLLFGKPILILIHPHAYAAPGMESFSTDLLELGVSDAQRSFIVVDGDRI